MLRQLLVVIILYLIINQLILYFSETKNNDNDDDKKENFSPKTQPSDPNLQKKVKRTNREEREDKNTINPNSVENIVPLDLYGEPREVVPNKYIIWSFTQPIPWNQIVYVYQQAYPFRFFIKVNIPSLNDYQAWKQIIPNLDFDSRSGELIIPSKNEESALAICNLIVSTFQGQLTIENILEKNLIEISVMKAQQYELVKNKLREQIIEAISGKPNKFLNKTDNKPNDFEKDLANGNITNQNGDNPENFNNQNEPLAYEFDNLAYL
jgi:hypothetical protein